MPALATAAALVLATLLLAQRLAAADPPVDPAPAGPAVADAALAGGIPLCEAWEARLHAALQRPVSVHVAAADALDELQRIGELCELPMVVDLRPDRPALPRIAIDADGVPLGAVLDAIARQLALRAVLRCGTVWWEVPGEGQAIGGPTALWVYAVDPAKLPHGCDLDGLIDQLRSTTTLDWSREGVSIDERNWKVLYICHTPAAQLRIERFLRDRLRWPAIGAARVHAAKLLPAAFSDMPEGERLLRAALMAPVTIDGGATTLAQVVDAVAKAAGVRIAADHGVSFDRPLALRTAEIHLQGLEARHALALALAGSGLHAELRCPATGAKGSVVIAAGKAQLVQRRYDLNPLLQVRRDGTEDSKPEVEDFIDIIQHVVMPSSWRDDGVSVEEYNGAMIVVHSVEAQDAIEDMLARLGRILLIGDVFNRCPVPPAIVIEAPTSHDF